MQKNSTDSKKNKEYLYSFDVFDTCLTRIYAKPTDLFRILGEQLCENKIIDISAVDWMQLRIKSESLARKQSNKAEITLEEIYDALALLTNCSKETALTIMQMELLLEQNSLRVIPEIYKHISELVSNNKPFFYISDMYLSQEAVRDLLAKNNFKVDEANLYVSSEHNATKANGLLYKKILSENDIHDASQLVHVGDNPSVDVKQAHKSGVNGVLFKASHLNRYEKLIANSKKINSFKLQTLIPGISRLTRLNKPSNLSEHTKVIWDVSSSVVGPVLFHYVYWCLQEARKRGLKRLYFVSRDGQILLKIAKVLCKNWDINDIECRYLYGSRKAWHFPTMESLNDMFYSPILDYSLFTVNIIFKIINTDSQLYKNKLEESDFPENTWNQLFDDKMRSRFIDFLDREGLTEKLLTEFAKSRQNAIGYLRQEGLEDETPYAIVDIGWYARNQTALAKILEQGNFYPSNGLLGLYFCIEKIGGYHPKDTIVGLFEASRQGRDIVRLLTKYKLLFELFVSGDHGGTTSYDCKDGVYFPVLNGEKNKEAIEWGLLEQQDACVMFADLLSKECPFNDVSLDDLRIISLELLKKFIFFPKPEEAKVYGAWAYSEDIIENVKDKKAAPELSVFQFMLFTLKMTLKVIKCRGAFWGLWHSGILVLAFKRPIALIDNVTEYSQDFAGRIYNKISNLIQRASS